MASQKSKLLDPIRAIDNATVSAPSSASCASGVIIFDLSVIVSQNADKPFSTFKDFFQFIWKKLLFEGRNHGRMDIVTDNYTKRNVLKEGTQLLRGSGTTVHLDPDSKFPPDFRKNFLRNSQNKAALYHQMAEFMSRESSVICDKCIVVTQGEEVLANMATSLGTCNHLEADVRIIVHIIDAIQSGCDHVTVRTVDSDIVILLVGFMSHFRQVCLSHGSDPDLLSVFALLGSSKNLEYLDIVNVTQKMTVEQCQGLIMLHAFTGCDFVEAFYQHGKKSFYKVYENDPGVCSMMANLTFNPEGLSIEHLYQFEQFVLKVYGSKCPDLVSARYDAIHHGAPASLRLLPPSRGALVQHVRRTVYVAGFYWGKASISMPDMPDPIVWGWAYANGRLKPHWTNRLGDYKLMEDKLTRKCSCRSKCSICHKMLCRNCKCNPCYAHCECRGDCCICNS